MLHKRTVSGINDDTIQCCLLAKIGFTFEKALEIAQGIGAANSNMCKLYWPSANYKPTIANGEMHPLSK